MFVPASPPTTACSTRRTHVLHPHHTTLTFIVRFQHHIHFITRRGPRPLHTRRHPQPFLTSPSLTIAQPFRAGSHATPRQESRQGRKKPLPSLPGLADLGPGGTQLKGWAIFKNSSLPPQKSLRHTSRTRAARPYHSSQPTPPLIPPYFLAFPQRCPHPPTTPNAPFPCPRPLPTLLQLAITQFCRCANSSPERQKCAPVSR